MDKSADKTIMFTDSNPAELTYYDIAMRTYRSLDAFFDAADKTDWYNPFATECQQIVEKLLKDLLTRILPLSSRLESLLRSHDLGTLARAINSVYPNTLRIQDCTWLTDYYFDTRYPGDNFFVVTRYDALEVRKVTDALVESINSIRGSLSKTTDSFFENGGCDAR